ncbi:MAG: hypothetical protein ACR2NO_07780 [Chloroflexota bacterium]
MSIWDIPLDKLRASRLLALRMHVARYVVRTGAAQPSVVALLDHTTAARHGGKLLELLEAAGAQSPQLMNAPDDPEAALPVANVMVFGAGGRSAAEVAERWRERVAAAAPYVWAIDVDRLAGALDDRIVDSIEALIRIVIPEALGANGTPPSEEVALRIA